MTGTRTATDTSARPGRAVQRFDRRIWFDRGELSVLSRGSLLSAASHGSILSIGSAGSILSIGSAGSILSIGSAGSILSFLSFGSANSRWSLLSIGGDHEHLVRRTRAHRRGAERLRTASLTALTTAAVAAVALGKA